MEYYNAKRGFLDWMMEKVTNIADVYGHGREGTQERQCMDIKIERGA